MWNLHQYENIFICSQIQSQECDTVISTQQMLNKYLLKEMRKLSNSTIITNVCHVNFSKAFSLLFRDFMFCFTKKACLGKLFKFLPIVSKRSHYTLSSSKSSIPDPSVALTVLFLTFEILSHPYFLLTQSLQLSKKILKSLLLQNKGS